MRNEIYISVDIEADGPIPGDYSMTEIGACVVGVPQLTFSAYLRPMTDKFIPEAANVGTKTRDWLLKHGEDPHACMMRFSAWVKEVSLCGVPVYVGFNAPFDWSFTHWYFIHFLDDDPFGHKALDTKAYIMGKLRLAMFSETSMSLLPPVFAPSRPLSHSALDDAIQQAEIFQKALAYSKT